MTIKEFIEAFDEDSAYAEYDEQGNVYIYDSTYDLMMARLEKESSVWEVEDDTFTMSPSLLRLMADLADTPPAKRKEPTKYVILNGKPIEKWLRHSTTYKKYFIWRFFQIGDAEEWLKGYTTSNPELLIGSAYTLEQLEDKKQLLPEKWRDAIDNMLTPLDVALRGEYVDKPDYGLEERIDNLEERIEEMEDKK